MRLVYELYGYHWTVYDLDLPFEDNIMGSFDSEDEAQIYIRIYTEGLASWKAEYLSVEG